MSILIHYYIEQLKNLGRSRIETDENLFQREAAKLAEDGSNSELEKEYVDFQEGEEIFYHPYMAPHRMENSVIDFDLQNLQRLLVENKEESLWRRSPRL